MEIATKDFLEQHEQFCDAVKERIRNTTDNLVITGKIYYVSNEGDDENDGLSPERPWKSMRKVNCSVYEEGDAVLFRRGDLFRGNVGRRHNGVTFGAYGTGKKPTFYDNRRCGCSC